MLNSLNPLYENMNFYAHGFYLKKLKLKINLFFQLLCWLR